jgi:Regulator of chromosome condensation (RCC1) repeat
VLVLLSLGVAAASGAGSAGASRETAAGAKVVALAGGLYHSLALTSSGSVFAWGWNMTGQLGNGSIIGSDVPVKVRLPGGTRATALAAGFAHSVALTSSGAALTWGKNYGGELGNGTNADSAGPARANLPAGTKLTAVAASEHNLALTKTGALIAWGEGQFGELGNGGTGSSATPVSVSLPAGTKVTAVAVGAWHSLALTSTGKVLAWGFNMDGELGDGNRTNTDVPVAVKLPAGTKVVAVAAAGFLSMALTSTGTVLAWGYNGDGELGNGTKRSSDVPVRVKLPPHTKVTKIAAGGYLSEVGAYVGGPGHGLALTSSGTVLAWGYNGNGELGNGTTTNSAVPVKVKLPGPAKAVAAGTLQSLALTRSGAVLAWGGNNFGQLGDGNYAASDVPVHVNVP